MITVKCCITDTLVYCREKINSTPLSKKDIEKALIIEEWVHRFLVLLLNTPLLRWKNFERGLTEIVKVECMNYTENKFYQKSRFFC